MPEKPREDDWKKFRAMVPVLRDRYLARQNSALVEILQDTALGDTERFWDAEEKIQKEAQILRRCLDGHSRSKLVMFMARMYRHEMLPDENLKEFSDELPGEGPHPRGNLNTHQDGDANRLAALLSSSLTTFELFQDRQFIPRLAFLRRCAQEKQDRMPSIILLALGFAGSLATWIIGIRPYVVRNKKGYTTGANLGVALWIDWQNCGEISKENNDSVGRSLFWTFGVFQAAFAFGFLLMVF